MKNTYGLFKESVKTITHYYTLLVEETKEQRLVGSTNEWVLDNYYMVSEQEKILKVELKGLEKGLWKVDSHRQQQLTTLLTHFLKKCHYSIDKTLLFRYLTQVQTKQKDYLSYPEVLALLPLLKTILIGQLAHLCQQLQDQKDYRYSPTDKSRFDTEKINKAAGQNLEMMNIWLSLRKITKLPLAEVIDAVSLSERTLKEEKAGMYDQMYDKTKEDYRARIVRMCRKSKTAEHLLVKELVEKAEANNQHVGWGLFPPKSWEARARTYICVVAAATLLAAALFALAALNTPSTCSGTLSMSKGWIIAVVLTVLMIVPMSQIVIDLFNWLLGKLHKPTGTFKLKFKDGLIPKEYTTMVIMPTILKNKEKTIQLMEQLEVYYLSNIRRDCVSADAPLTQNANAIMHSHNNTFNNIYYTLIGDAAAYNEADAPWDEEVTQAGLEKVRELNEKYGAPIFNFVYRQRAWSEGEQTWLGHERKRGAILDFNDLVLGRISETERRNRFRCETISPWLESMNKCVNGSLSCSPFDSLSEQNSSHVDSFVKFIITLDTDTELVLYSAQKLIGAMAHPLNRAQLSADGRRVERGYGIMQPRVNVDVEVTNKSRYAQLFAGLGGLDVYTTASFELYQDIFNEGSFCGKGIYDLQVFQQVLKGTFPENLILSHDLIEGCHIRCGLVNDLELFDDNPSNYIDDAKRHHRWTRGDWQIIGWLKNTVRNEKGEKVKNQVNTIGRWKIFDNLRRSVLSLSLLVVVLFGFTGLTRLHPVWFVLVTLLAVASPIVFFIVGQLTSLPRFGKRYHYYATLMRGFRVIIYRSIVQFALLPKEAWMYTDALVRACYRMWFSHRNLLAWITSDEAAKSTKGTLGDYVSKFWFNYVAASIVLALAIVSEGNTLTMASALFCFVTWVGAPVLMYWLGLKFPQEKRSLNVEERAEVEQLARDTWHFFDSLVKEENHWLIPDNYQLNREEKSDYKTSPTNIGYSMTAIVSAAELGFITEEEAVKRLGNIVDTVIQLEKWNGHLFNWYELKSLNKLPNYFVSTCDSGNFVACLYVVNGFLSRIQGGPGVQEIPTVKGVHEKIQRLIDETDFSKLYNSELDVFSIGYDYSARTLLPYHYNNFASEARLTSYLTIAQGDAPYKHWFCLDKTLVEYRGYKGVASWYGTLFEYFMPLIFLPTYRHTLMDETYSFAIRAQRAFIKNTVMRKRFNALALTRKCVSGRKEEIPWGISETAYNEMDDAQNYKYHAFGVPYLKFQNTTPDRIVVSPYSSLMTISIDDRAVYSNIQRFKNLGMYDRNLGFFESYDEEDHVPVRAHYAHHQGMILASLTNYLTDNRLQRYFMHEPTMRSMETLLKEKVQVKPYIDLKVTQYKRYQYSKVQTESDAREYNSISPVPEIGVLSNGNYTVLLNDRGSGFSRYKDIYLNRYRKISADHYGNYLFIRNLRSDELWSATYAPLDQMPNTYHVTFASDKIRFLRVDGNIETKTDITVLKDRSAEIRRYTFTNNGNQDADLELTTYAEVILARHNEDESHRVFASMKVLSEYDSQHQALLFNRPAIEGNRHYAIHRLWIAPDTGTRSAEMTDTSNNPELRLPMSDLVEYETSRLKFLGRGGSLQHADIIESRRTLTGTVGTTLDPVMSMRRRIHVPAGKEVEVYALTGYAKAKEQLLQIAEQYQTRVDIDYAFETASVYNNMRTSMSTLKGVNMRLYNSISKYIGQTATLGNLRQDVLAHNRLSQSGLWRFGISGDYAVVLMEVDSMTHAGFAKEMLRAYEYYKVHGLVLDIVIVNDIEGDDHDNLTHFVRNMADTQHLWAVHQAAGNVYILDGRDISDDERILLRTVARLDFNTSDGLTIEQQLQRLEAVNQIYQDKIEYPALRPRKEFRVWSSLKYYNQYGGFDNDGRDYVITNTNTPMPWVNVIANEQHFGCIVSATMAGFTFAYNAQQFKLTGWSNDIVRDNASEMLLLNRQQFLPATARHSQGWSAFDAEYDNLTVNVRLFIAVDKMEKYYQIKLKNRLASPQVIQLDMVYKLVLGDNEERTARYLYSEWDKSSNTLRVRNVYHPTYSDKVVLLSSTEPLTDISLAYPNRKRLGFSLTLAPDGEKELAFVISVDSTHYTPPTITALNTEFQRVVDYWNHQLGTIQVETPDRSLDYMLNRWYLYQVYTSRLFARAGFYQVGGATGFRDQLQDVMSLLYSNPEYARRQILDHAAHQFAEGDVLHWWHESMHLGARTTFSDDYLWLPYVTYQYVHITGDITILTEVVPFCQADPLAPGEAERGIHYTLPSPDSLNSMNSQKTTLYEHLRRATDRAMTRTGVHGLPLMGCGDWNDGMSSIGVLGKGESVWVALFLADLLPKMEELTQLTPGSDLAYCEDLAAFRTKLVAAIQSHAWDGNWFLRAYNDKGDPIGSRNNIECQIDLICQAWSILTDVATENQKQSIFRETDNRLVNREHEIIQLLTPAFQHSNPSPGYIMDYPVGVRENGGQYTHGAMWYIMAQLKEGRYDMAYYLYSLINPIHRTNSLADVLKYKVEPYCIAADIYSNPQHPGRGGWTWYTGSASWAYKTGIENILGLHKKADTLTLDPQIPSDWPGFSIRYQYGSATYLINVCRGNELSGTVINLVDDGQIHVLDVCIK